MWWVWKRTEWRQNRWDFSIFFCKFFKWQKRSQRHELRSELGSVPVEPALRALSRRSIWECRELRELQGAGFLPTVMQPVSADSRRWFSIFRASFQHAISHELRTRSELCAISRASRFRAESAGTTVCTMRHDILWSMQSVHSTVRSMRAIWTLPNAVRWWLSAAISLPTDGNLQPNVLALLSSPIRSTAASWKLQTNHQIPATIAAYDEWHNLQELVRMHRCPNSCIMSHASSSSIRWIEICMWSIRQGNRDEGKQNFCCFCTSSNCLIPALVPTVLPSWACTSDLSTLAVASWPGTDASSHNKQARFCSKVPVQARQVYAARQHPSIERMLRGINDSEIVVHEARFVQLFQVWIMQASHLLPTTAMWV